MRIKHVHDFGMYPMCITTTKIETYSLCIAETKHKMVCNDNSETMIELYTSAIKCIDKDS